MVHASVVEGEWKFDLVYELCSKFGVYEKNKIKKKNYESEKEI